MALTGVALHQFYAAMILLGIGWNFGYIGASSLLTAHHRPEERAKVQGMNDFLVMATVATAALSSGVLFDAGGGDADGWSVVVLAMLVPVAIAGSALLWRRRTMVRA